MNEFVMHICSYSN